MNSLIQTRIDSKKKKEAETILNQLGLSLNDGIRMFICQVTLAKGIPFMPLIPRELNETSKQVIKDTEQGINCEKFNTCEELFQDLGI